MVAIFKLLLFTLTCSATPLLRRDVITVENDITQKIEPQITTLNKDVNGYPASGLNGALAIHSDIQQLVATVNTATDNIKSTGSFGTVAGTTIVAQFQSIVPAFLEAIVNLGAQVSDWVNIPGGRQLVLNDLEAMNAAFVGYFDAMIGAEPILLKAGAVALKAQVNGAFVATIAEYTAA
ncbi:hypothetical protein TWF694_011435 [Orbilia ellipsospora]|uniref:Hydrophobic surface binding protein n=1 Tax=Orbilia ellipsospora TaxID=2528407 RepID=A0AAV9X5J8_9PEZI